MKIRYDEEKAIYRWCSPDERSELTDRNKALKALIELKSRWMQFEEGEHRRKMQELAEEIKSLRVQLRELEKDNV